MSEDSVAPVVTFGVEQIEVLPGVCAIGVFDGVHVGHRDLLGHLVVDARFRGVPAVVVTFDPDPDEVIDPTTSAPRLLTHRDRVAALARTGVDLVAVIPFTPELAATEPIPFLDTVLSKILTPVAVHVGHDFRFGARGAGTVETIGTWARTHDGLLFPYPLHSVGGAPVTATRIRSLISAGEVGIANELLGTPYRIRGIVSRGRGEGRTIGFPTANVRPETKVALPAEGVYAGMVVIDGVSHPAAISVGVPPTFPGSRDYLEAHLLDFDDDLYGKSVELEFVSRVRGQKVFGSLAELTAGISADVEQIRGVLGVGVAGQG